jgi:hypothetical protein
MFIVLGYIQESDSGASAAIVPELVIHTFQTVNVNEQQATR